MPFLLFIGVGGIDMKIEIELSERAEQFLGPDHSEAVAKLAEKEAQRLWYIERCKPKEHLVRPVGRPRLTPEKNKAREIAKFVGHVYVELRQQLSPEGFEKRHGDDYRRFQAAREKDDLDTLLGFEKEVPWQNR